MTTLLATEASDREHIVFSFPKLSRRVNRDLWIDRFVTSFMMDQNGGVPENTSWLVIDPDQWPDEIDYVPAMFDLIAITSDDIDSLIAGYQRYSAAMRVSHAEYAEEEEMEEFLPSIPVRYTPNESDVVYSLADRSAYESLREIYIYPNEEGLFIDDDEQSDATEKVEAS